jgi:hypothetical protein
VNAIKGGCAVIRPPASLVFTLFGFMNDGGVGFAGTTEHLARLSEVAVFLFALSRWSAEAARRVSLEREAVPAEMRRKSSACRYSSQHSINLNILGFSIV